jgi:hypothetical protein
MPSKRKAANLLRKTAKLLEDKGWAQLTWGNDTSGYCAIGGLRMVQFNYPYSASSDPNYQLARKALRTVLGGVDVIAWNDTPGRTAEEVIKLFRKTAAELDHGLVVSNG